MSGDISKFAAVINKRGVASNNRYAVLIPPFRGINIFGNSLANIVLTQVGNLLPGNSALGAALLATKAELPSRSFLLMDKREGHKPVEQIPYIDSPATVDLSFIVGRDMFEYFFFEAWMNDVVSRETFTSNYYDEYTTSIIISKIDEKDTVIASVELEGCYPVMVSPIQLDSSFKNDFIVLHVQMRYKRYRPIMTPFSLIETGLSILNRASGAVGGFISGLF